MQHWAQVDYAGAAQWIQSQPAGTSRTKAIEAYVDAVSSQEPAAAAAWVSQLDGKQSQYRIDNIARNWLRYDEAAARQWILSLPLTPEKQQQLLKRGSNNGD